MRGLALFVLLFAAACGKTHKAGKTPKETVKSFEAAIRDLELGQCYGLLTKSAQREVDGAMRALKGMAAALPSDKLADIGMKGIKDMTTSEVMDASIKYAKRSQPTSLKRLKQLQLVVLEVKEYGDRARVRVCQILGGREREFMLPMAREGGLWKIDSGIASLNLPVRLGPDLQAAATPVFT